MLDGGIMRPKDYIEIDQTLTQGYIALMQIDSLIESLKGYVHYFLARWHAELEHVVDMQRSYNLNLLYKQRRDQLEQSIQLYKQRRDQLEQSIQCIDELEYRIQRLKVLVCHALADVTNDTKYDYRIDASDENSWNYHLYYVRELQQYTDDIFAYINQINTTYLNNFIVVENSHQIIEQLARYIGMIEDMIESIKTKRARFLSAYSLRLPNQKTSGSLPFFITLKNNEEIRKIFEKFTLFAFVLYVPQEHPEIMHALQRRYQTLHEDTGKDFLFFSFFKPSRTWLKQQRSQDEPYADMLNIPLFDAKKQRIHVNKSSKKIKQEEIRQSELHISLVSQQLQISYAQMPCLVVTTSLHSSQEYIVVPFSQHDLSAKLIKLGEIATAYAAKQSSSLNLNDTHLLKNDTNLLKNDTYLLEIVRQELSKSYSDTIVSYILDPFIDSLIDMLDISAFTDTSETKSRLERYQELIQHLRGSLASLADVDLLESDYAQQRMKRLDRYCDVVCRLLAQYADLLTLPSSSNAMIDVDTQLLETESALFLSTFQRVWSAYQSLYAESSTQLDYSTFTISLTKMIENEINLSIIQVVRQLLGIDFPTWYNTYQEGKKAKIISGKLEIDFNRFVHKQLVLPGIGQSYTVAKYSSLKDLLKHKVSMYAQPEFTSRDIDVLYAQLLEQWELLIPKRNQSAHGAVVDESAFNDVIQIVTQFRDIFRLLACIKQKMRH
jgi:hypothetical protein